MPRNMNGAEVKSQSGENSHSDEAQRENNPYHILDIVGAKAPVLQDSGHLLLSRDDIDAPGYDGNDDEGKFPL